MALQASHFSWVGIHGLCASSSLRSGVLNEMVPDWPSSLCVTLLCPYTTTNNPTNAAVIWVHVFEPYIFRYTYKMYQICRSYRKIAALSDVTLLSKRTWECLCLLCCDVLDCRPIRIDHAGYGCAGSVRTCLPHVGAQELWARRRHATRLAAFSGLRSTNVDSMLAQRRRRGANIEPTLDEYICELSVTRNHALFAGKSIYL